MDLQEMIAVQHNFDKAHGWSLKSNDPNELLSMINKDLIGLFGEIGEFSNIVKKLNLERGRVGNEECRNRIEEARKSLDGELIDCLIYLIRLATHLDTDIEEVYLRKLAVNDEKYKWYELNHGESTSASSK
jgi:NTP pyrophosphatase (non-canonical NTP hydrolase)